MEGGEEGRKQEERVREREQDKEEKLNVTHSQWAEVGTTCCGGCIQNTQETRDQVTVVLQWLVFLLCMSDNAVGKRVAPVCLGIRLLTVASGFSEKASSSLGWMPAKGGREGQ